jgi:probable blue pigment (indigoidine) exporter
MPRNLTTVPLLLPATTALAPIVWGTSYLVTTEFLPPDRPLLAAVLRTLPAGLLLILCTRAKPVLPWGRLLVLALLNIGAFQALLFVSAYRLPGGIAAIIGALQPLIILLMAWAVDHERPRRSMIAATGTGVAGMALLFAAPGLRLDTVGVAAALGGTLSMAAGTFLARRWRDGMPLLGFTGWQLALGGLMLVPVAWGFEPALPSLTWRAGLGYAYLGLIGTLIAYALWFRGVARLEPVAVSALGLLSPVTAIVLGWVFLGQRFGIRESAGLLLVFVGICALQLRVSPVRSAPGSFSSSFQPTKS